MRERIDDDLFYDTNVASVTITELDDAPTSADQFFRHEANVPAEHGLVRFAMRPWVFAMLMFGPGFFTVFVMQAPIWYQIVLGAPIFEEMVKFGLALLICHALGWLFSGGSMRTWRHPGWLGLRLPVGLAVGAGFGVMEHYVTYSSEPFISYIWRIAFHSITTGLSMVILNAVLRSDDPRLLWGAVLPSVFVHYVNNTLAVVGLAAWLLFDVDLFGSWMSLSLMVGLLVMLVWFTLLPRPIRQFLAHLARRLPTRTRPSWKSDDRTHPTTH